MNDIFKRRSIRNFSNEEVSLEDINKMIEAAVQSPSARNQKPWHFVILDETKKEELMKMSHGAQNLKEANKFVAFVMDLSLSNPEFAPLDMSACVNNFMLEAYNLGIGSLWVGVYPITERMQYLNNLLQIKEPFQAFALVGLGYPKNKDDFKFLDRFDESRIHVGKW